MSSRASSGARGGEDLGRRGGVGGRILGGGELRRGEVGLAHGWLAADGAWRRGEGGEIGGNNADGAERSPGVAGDWGKGAGKELSFDRFPPFPPALTGRTHIHIIII